LLALDTSSPRSAQDAELEAALASMGARECGSAVRQVLAKNSSNSASRLRVMGFKKPANRRSLRGKSGRKVVGPSWPPRRHPYRQTATPEVLVHDMRLSPVALSAWLDGGDDQGGGEASRFFDITGARLEVTEHFFIFFFIFFLYSSIHLIQKNYINFFYFKLLILFFAQAADLIVVTIAAPRTTAAFPRWRECTRCNTVSAFGGRRSTACSAADPEVGSANFV